jgi:hypothetical protein
VDNFREGKLTPCCQLKAEVSGRRKKIPVLNHRVRLKGARRPYNFFTLELPINGIGIASDVCIKLYDFSIVDPNSQATQSSGDLSSAGIVQVLKLLDHACMHQHFFIMQNLVLLPRSDLN